MEQLISDELFPKTKAPSAVIRKPEDNDGIRPYWNPFVRDVSGKIWVPPSELPIGLPDMPVAGSWFSALTAESSERGISFACLSLFGDIRPL